MTSPIFYIDGHFVCQEKAFLPVCDLSILRGCAIFDYLRTYQGRPFHLDEHLMRLAYSANQVGLALPHSLETIKELIYETKRLNPFEEASIKVIVTGGVSEDQFTPAPFSKLLILVYPLQSYPESCYTQGIKVITTPLNRTFPQAKTTNYLPAISALNQTRSKGAKEAIYLNSANELLEGTTSNLFLIRGGSLYTCDSEEILFGITREVVMQIASPYFNIEKRSLSHPEIDTIDEAFLTASNKEIMPIVAIDDIPVGLGKVGSHTIRLMNLFREYTQQSEWPLLPIFRHTISNSLLVS